MHDEKAVVGSQPSIKGIDFNTTQETGVRAFLDSCRPLSALNLLTDSGFQPDAFYTSLEPSLAWVYLAEALVDLDRAEEALSLLEKLVTRYNSELRSDIQSLIICKAEILRAQVLLKIGFIDQSILAAIHAEKLTSQFSGNETEDLRALAQIWCAVGYGMKRCYTLSEAYMHTALETAPTNPRVLAGLARLRIESDRRTDARRIFMRMGELPYVWAKLHADWGLGYIAYLLGEFTKADHYARQALNLAPETVMPLFVVAQTALARSDVNGLAEAIAELIRRCPKSEMIPVLQTELLTLNRRLEVHEQDYQTRGDAPVGKGKRLTSFPTLVQYHDTCGPAVVELVLRYWAGITGSPPKSDAISQKIKYPHSGTPIYRMREYFHLYGFDTVRCQAPVDVLKKLIDAGLPVIIQQEFSNTAHVSVVIGYDDSEGLIDVQDPMTHIVLNMAEDELNHLRRNYLDAALIAYPRFFGHEQTLARLGIYNDPVLEEADRVILDFDLGRFEEAANLMENNVRRQPGHALSWMLLLHARNEILSELQAMGKETSVDDLSFARQLFYSSLERASKAHPRSEFVRQFEGWGALHDHDYSRARLAFDQASKIDPDDARNWALLAECHFSLYSISFQENIDTVLEYAERSLHNDPSSLAANIWMARGLAASAGLASSGMGLTGGTWIAWQDDERGVLTPTLTAALHYARSAVDIDSSSGLAHLALAEVLWQISPNHINGGNSKIPTAEEELNTALLLSPNLAEASLAEAVILAQNGVDGPILENILTGVMQIIESEQLSMERLRAERAESKRASLRRLPVLPTNLHYAASKTLVELQVQAGQMNQAARYLDRLLEDFPRDSWALAMRANVLSENLLRSGVFHDDSGEELQIPQIIHNAFTAALEASPGNIFILENYLQYMQTLAGSEYALMVLEQVVDIPSLSEGPFARHAPRVNYLYAGLLLNVGKNIQAADRFLAAIAGQCRLGNDHELYESIVQVIEFLGVKNAVQRILDSDEKSDCLPRLSIQRALGLALIMVSSNPESPHEQNYRLSVCRRLLGNVLVENPDDAQVALALGHAASSSTDREILYRRALMIAPGWSQARAILADFLTETGRPDQALDYTRGFATINEAIQADREQIELESAHGRALLGAGYYEDAVEIFSKAIDHLVAYSGQEEGNSELINLLNLYAGRWQAEFRSSQLVQALRTAREALSLCPDRPDLRRDWFLRLANTLRRLDRYNEADRAIQSGRAYGLSELDVLRAEYETEMARRDFLHALDALDTYMRHEMSEKYRGGIRGQLGWGGSERLRLLIKIGRFDEAVGFLNNENLSAEGWGLAAWNLILSDAGEPGDALALQAAEHALSLDPTNQDGLFARAEALTSLELEDDAFAAWVALRDSQPDNHTAYEKLALWSAVKGDLPQALQFANRAIELGAFCPFSWAARGVVGFLQNKNDESLGDLQMAWNRADPQQRSRNQVYWLLLSALREQRRGTGNYYSRNVEMRPVLQDLGYIESRLLKIVLDKLYPDQLQ